MTEPGSTPTPAAAPGGGRRRAAETSRGRPSPVTVLAVVIPLLTIATLALVRPAEQAPTSYAPSEAPLDRVTVVCPARLPGADEVRIGSTSLVSDDVTLRVGRQDDTQALSDGVATRTERQYVVVHASGDVAPGLVASRSGSGSATGCDQPAPERWFTGAGASSEHASTLTLINPDRGPAVADVTVWDGSALVDVPALRGVRVPGGRSTSFDLSEVVPNRDALALRVSVSRGLGREPLAHRAVAPASTSYVAGIGTTAADRVLSLANPGDSEVRVALELVSEESEFAPSRLEEVTLDPASVREVDLSRVLRGRNLTGVQALRVEATGPVTATLRTRTPADLALTPAGPTVEGDTAVALPAGSRRIVVTGATAPGLVTLQAWNEDGEVVVRERRVEIDPATAARIRVPDEAVLAQVRVQRTGAVVSVEVSDRGLSVLPLSQLGTTSEVADVRPAQR